MFTNQSTTVDGFMESVPEERQELVGEIRRVILENLPEGYEEAIEFGMLSYVVPLERFPDTYNGRPLMYVSVASQKKHVSVYLMGVYSDPETEEWFRLEYEKFGKRLNMGKSCVRFRKLDEVPFDLIGRAVKRMRPDEYIDVYHRSREQTRAR